MSAEFNSDLDALIAAGLGANKGFWMIQPRDDEGQWIEMGANVLFKFRTGKGNLVVGTAHGVYVGPAGKPGKARVLITDSGDSGLTPGVYEVTSRNLQQFKALIKNDSGKSSTNRKDKFGKPVRTLSDSQLPTARELLANRQDATEEDKRFAEGKLTPEEAKANLDARNESPIANLPAGFETDNPEEVEKLLSEAGAKQKKPSAEPEIDLTPEEIIDGKKPGTVVNNDGSVDLELGRERVINGYDANIGAENRRKEYKRIKLEKALGRKLTPEEIRALGLQSEDASAMRKPSNDGVLIFPSDNSEEAQKARKQVAKNAEIRKQLKDELAGVSSKKEDTGVSPSPSPLNSKNLNKKNSEYDIPMKDVMADVQYNGDTDQTVDSLVEKSQSLSALRDAAIEKSVFDLERGDKFIDANGEERTITNIRIGSTYNYVESVGPNGQKRVDSYNGNARIAVSRVSRAQSRPAPTPEPEKVDTPDKPVDKVTDATPEVSEPVDTIPTPEEAAEQESKSPEINLEDIVSATPEGLMPENFPPKDRMDDGSNFDLPTYSKGELEQLRRTQLMPIMGPDGQPVMYVDENNNATAITDPFAMMSALAQMYPDAKFTEDGTLILHRQDAGGGKTLELRANVTGKKAVSYAFRWVNEDGSFTEYVHKDDRHSVAALLREDNGPQGLLDRLLGRTDVNGKDWGDPNNYKFGNTRYQRTDSLAKRFKWFLSGTGDRKKFETQREHALRMAEGHDAIFHKSTGTLKHAELPSLWDSFRDYYSSGDSAAARDEALKNDVYHVLFQTLGRAALNENAHALYRRALRDEFDRQFPERSVRQTRAFNALVTNASRIMQGTTRTPEDKVRAIRYASADRSKPIEAGMTVSYTNNVGDKMTLKVKSLITNINATPNNRASYDYGDFVVVEDANGNKVKINSLKLRILSDQNSDLTAYSPNLRGRELVEARRARGWYGSDVGPQESTATSVRPRINWDEIAPPRGTDTIAAPPLPTRIAEDVLPGEMLYSSNGDPLGVVKSKKFITSRDGREGVAFLYTNANGQDGQVAYELGTELAGSRRRASGQSLSFLREVATSHTTDGGFDLPEDLWDDTPEGFMAASNPIEEIVSSPAVDKFPELIKLSQYGGANAKENLRILQERLSMYENELGKARLDFLTSGANYTLGTRWKYDQLDFEPHGLDVSETRNLIDSFSRSDLKDPLANYLELARSSSVSDEKLMNQLLAFLRVDDPSLTVSDLVAKKLMSGVKFNAEVDTYRGNVTATPIKSITVPFKYDRDLGIVIPAVDMPEYRSALDLYKQFVDTYDVSPNIKNHEINIKLVADRKDFYDQAKTLDPNSSATEDTLGINITLNSDGSAATRSANGTDSITNKSSVILINASAAANAAPEYSGQTGVTDTVLHEIGHTYHRVNALNWGLPENSSTESYINGPMQASDVTKYGADVSPMEHFAESFAKYLGTGQASPEFKQYLKDEFGISEWDISSIPDLITSADKFSTELQTAINEALVDHPKLKFIMRGRSSSFTKQQLARAVANGQTISIMIHGNLVDETGTPLPVTNQRGDGNQITRTLEYDPKTGKLIVKHDYFVIPLGLQGSSIGSAAVEGMFDYYKKSGISEVQVHAALTNGPYTWALRGFNWDMSPNNARYSLMNRSDLHSQIKNYYKTFAMFQDLQGSDPSISLRSDLQLAAKTLSMMPGGPSWYTAEQMLKEAKTNGWNISELLPQLKALAEMPEADITPFRIAMLGRGNKKSASKNYSTIGRLLMMSTGSNGWYGVKEL